MSRLNKKNGNLRGVWLSYNTRDNPDWSMNHGVIGWVVFSSPNSTNSNHKFNLNFDIDGRTIEIQLSRNALSRILNVVEDADKLVLQESV